MPDTYVLVHGSWHGGWAWEPTAWCLREAGHRVFAPTLPGHHASDIRAGITHDDYVRAVSSFVDGLDLRGIILVGHSFGGTVVSRASQLMPERISRLVFLSAFVLAHDTTVSDNLPEAEARAIAEDAATSPDNTVGCPWPFFRNRFIQDADEPAARSVWERLVPQPYKPYTARLDLAVFHRGELPRSYIALRDDAVLPPGAFHPMMSSRLGRFKLVEMDGGHEVMFTRPVELSRNLIEAAHD